MGTHNDKWIFMVLLLMCSNIIVHGQGVVTIKNLDYTGGNATCTDCSNQGGQYYPTFECSDGDNWNDGIVSFMDPIPPGMGYVLWNATATVYGRFDCNGTSPYQPMGITFIAGEYIGDGVLPTATGDCNCPNCVLPAAFGSNNYPNGWPSYNYGKYNTFQFQPESLNPDVLVCVSYVDLTFYYGPTNYQVTSIDPDTGPASGGTKVTVNGDNFLPLAITTWCSFGGSIIAAAVANDTIVCSAPSATCPSYPCNVTVEISQNSLGFTFNNINFTYTPVCVAATTCSGHGTCTTTNLCQCSVGYAGDNCDTCDTLYTGYPNCTKTGAAGVPGNSLLWVWIAVGVCAGSVVLVIAAGYIYAKSNTNKSARFVDEQSRLINSEKFKKYGSLHPIDMSEIIVQQRIGRGSCAEVYMGSWRGTTVAIKKAKVFADDDEEFFTELAQEAEIMSGLRHPNVLQFLGTASSPPDLVIVMEFMSRGSLYRIIHDKSIELAWVRLKQIALDIARGMNYLHCSDPIIIHRDLKSHNLLVDEHFKVKVCDFGLSTMVKRHLDKFTAMTPVGTPCWTAPEVLRNEPYTERADVFSFGVVMWELVTREDPYHGMPTFQIVIAVGQHNMRPIIPPSVSPALSTLISQCWSEDPSMRPPFTEIVQRLEKM